jgi:hypothetical protein
MEVFPNNSMKTSKSALRIDAMVGRNNAAPGSWILNMHDHCNLLSQTLDGNFAPPIDAQSFQDGSIQCPFHHSTLAS